MKKYEVVMKKPVVDLSDCVLCGVCVDVSPGIFRMNAAGFIDVIDLDQYDRVDVEEAIKNCPASCISWEDGI
jgi:ferredoxin